MIVCVSVNPAIDKRCRIDDLLIGGVNRIRSVNSFAGGKAAHVAMSAKALGEEVTWIGFLGGETGSAIELELTELGIEVVPVRTLAATRTNLEVIDDSGRITEILEPGGTISQDELEQFRSVCDETFGKAGDKSVVVLSGSLSPGVPVNEYAVLAESARKHGAMVILDASGIALEAALAASPDLIKPNRSEAEHAAGITISTDEDAVKAADILRGRGAKAVALTLGSDGLLLSRNGAPTIFARQPDVNVVSTVGCGDAAVAGFATALTRGSLEIDSVRLAAACGAANCAAKLPGQIERALVESLMDEIEVRVASDAAGVSAYKLNQC